jgi:hypothetical protein
MTKPELQRGLDQSLNFCGDYRKIIEEQDRQLTARVSYCPKQDSRQISAEDAD